MQTSRILRYPYSIELPMSKYEDPTVIQLPRWGHREVYESITNSFECSSIKDNFGLLLMSGETATLIKLKYNNIVNAQQLNVELDEDELERLQAILSPPRYGYSIDLSLFSTGVKTYNIIG